MHQTDHKPDYEREYDLNRAIPHLQELLATWPVRAAQTRANFPMQSDIPTGKHPRELLDLFRPAHDPVRGTVVFIHGGYWSASSKNDVSWVAEGFLDAGYSVALLNYPLCPEVSLEKLAESVRRSFAKLLSDILNQDERRSVVVVGHSAGAYLATSLAATDWRTYGLQPKPFGGLVAISGLYDLLPLLQIEKNAKIGLTPESAVRLSLVGAAPLVRVPAAFVFGEAETTEFHRQSQDMAKAWSALEPVLMEISGVHHFTVVDGLAQPGTPLQSLVMDMARQAKSVQEADAK